ncbi:MAG: nucleotidyltransferase domain-containing protein [Nitrospirae bacterium]|nr:nucleotidyltransferase domain-containing protein [Nitrospirota bacterium]
MVAEGSVRETILTVVDRIVKEYKPRKVILFGSYAYGTPDEDSDVDLLIIKDTCDRPVDRWVEVKRIIRGASGLTPVSPLVYTEKEVEGRFAIKDFFIAEVFEKGEVLYG